MNMQADPSMPSVPAALDKFATWWDGSRQAIHQWLQEHSPPLAELYLGASQLLCERNPGWTRFVPHAMREIANRLPSEICGEEMTKGRLEYPQRIEALAVLWEAHGAKPRLAEAEMDPEGAEVKVLKTSIWQEIDQLVRDHRDASTRNRERTLRMLQALAPESPPDARQLAWTASSWVEVGSRAAGKAHDQTRADVEQDADEIIEQFETLERTLLSVTRPFFENKDDLDALLEDTNA